MKKENKIIVALGLAVQARIDAGEITVALTELVNDAKAIMDDAGDDGSDKEDELQLGARAPPLSIPTKPVNRLSKEVFNMKKKILVFIPNADARENAQIKTTIINEVATTGFEPSKGYDLAARLRCRFWQTGYRPLLNRLRLPGKKAKCRIPSMP